MMLMVVYFKQNADLNFFAHLFIGFHEKWRKVHCSRIFLYLGFAFAKVILLSLTKCMVSGHSTLVFDCPFYLFNPPPKSR
jgi:hypothetical protein